MSSGFIPSLRRRAGPRKIRKVRINYGRCRRVYTEFDCVGKLSRDGHLEKSRRSACQGNSRNHPHGKGISTKEVNAFPVAALKGRNGLSNKPWLWVFHFFMTFALLNEEKNVIGVHDADIGLRMTLFSANLKGISALVRAILVRGTYPSTVSK